MDREEILLKEYEVCQKEADGSSRNYWTTLNIFIPFSTAVLTAIVLSVANNSTNTILLISAFIISLFGFGLFCYLHTWLKRVAHFIGINNLRMRQIESELGMKRSLLIWGLDNWDKINAFRNYKKVIAETWNDIGENIKNDLINDENSELPEIKKPPEKGNFILSKLLDIMTALWGLLSLFTFILLIYQSFTFNKGI